MPSRPRRRIAESIGRRPARRGLRERLEALAVFCALIPALWVVFDPPES